MSTLADKSQASAPGGSALLARRVVAMLLQFGMIWAFIVLVIVLSEGRLAAELAQGAAVQDILNAAFRVGES